MINGIEDLAYYEPDGKMILPSGPCSGWPLERNQPGPELLKNFRPNTGMEDMVHDTKVKVNFGQMAQNLVQTAKVAVTQGRLNQKERDQRYEICKACPHFIVDEKRCSECGCFMEAKTWLKGARCPVSKW